jgi:hypothetical protein
LYHNIFLDQKIKACLVKSDEFNWRLQHI